MRRITRELRSAGADSMRYIHERPEWPTFRWDGRGLSDILAQVRFRQGRLLGNMIALGFGLRDEAMLQTLTQDAVKSSEIEGVILDIDQVRSSIARRLGIDIGVLTPADRHVEGIVAMMLDAVQHYDRPLTAERLFGWHSALFPSGFADLRKITVGNWRNDLSGPMQVVSGPYGREKVHFEAPEATRVEGEMAVFLDWFNEASPVDPVYRAAIAHFWFVTIHPFEDGNGRIARAITDMALSRAEGSARRFYSMSAQIREDRRAYYRILEGSQKGDLDITPWLRWFLGCLDRSFDRAEQGLASVLNKANFWRQHAQESLNPRQRDMLNRTLEGFKGHVTSSKWAKIEKCSPDTALRDITDLVNRGILNRESAGGRSTHYSLVPNSRDIELDRKRAG